MCTMQEEPLLYITTPTFITEQQVNVNSDESTSVYEKIPVVGNGLIERQLRFFARPMKRARPLLLVLMNGERFIGTINEVNGTEVKVQCYDTVRLIEIQDIAAVSTAVQK